MAQLKLILRLELTCFIILLSLTVPLARFVGRDESTGTLFYELPEELSLQTVIADIFTDAQLSKDHFGSDTSGQPVNSLQFDILFGTFQNLFWIESPLGLLRINQTIDRDAICFKKTKCSLKIDLQVSGPGERIHIQRVVLNILDINDNTPTFHPPRLVLNISESTPEGTRFVLPTSAEDLDSGDFGNLRYEHSGNSSRIEFVVPSNQPEAEGDLYLVVAEKLDREEDAVYVMRVTASDGGSPSKSGFLEIVIFVEDANDNSPKFEMDTYNVSIREDFPHDVPFLRVRADDPDEGLNGQVVYSLGRPSLSAFGSLFHVDGATGDLYIKQGLDYQREHEYVLSVAAMDSGPSPVPVYARLVITVIDVNDNAPTIRVKSHLLVPEGTQTGALVGHVSVDDLDSEANGEVHCTVSNSEFLLEQIYPKIYKIVTNKIFDREEQEEYRVSVECRDNGQPRLTSSQDVVVRVTDINDNNPVFQQDVYSINVKENNMIGVPIMRITARDADVGENALVAYSLNNNSFLSIDSSTGIISTAVAFDFENKTQYEFVATATDQGLPEVRSATTKILLNIIDFNDEAPVFLQASYSFGTFENQSPGTEIGTVSAVDRDSAPFDRFTFSILQSKPVANIFKVNANTGKIIALRVLDREQYPVHYLTLAATDIAYPNPSSLVNVTINVADRNDNAPMIEFPNLDNFTAEVSVDASPGTRIARVIARDADIGQNARLEYTIAKGNDGDAFEIDSIEGTLTLKRPLMLFKDMNKFSLVLVVKDCGEPEKQASASLDIYVNRSTISVTAATGWMKTAFNHSSHLFNGSGHAVFSLELIIILLSVMAALLILLTVTIVYVRRRSRTVADRNPRTMTKMSPRSVDSPKYCARPASDEYTYRAADSVDIKDELASTLRLHSRDYMLSAAETAEDTQRTPTHYTFAKVNNDVTSAHLQGGSAGWPLLTTAAGCPSPNLASHSNSLVKSANPLAAAAAVNARNDIEFRRLLEVLRKAEEQRGEEEEEEEKDSCGDRASQHSNHDSGRGPSETVDPDHFQQNSLSRPKT